MAVIIGTLVVNVFVVWHERKRGRELGSAFLLADAAHTSSDILVTLMALTSLVFARSSAPWLDAVLAIGVALIIAWSGVQILRESIPDARRRAGDRRRRPARGGDRRARCSRRAERAVAVHRVGAAVRRSHDRAWRAHASVDQAHRLADAVEAAIEREFGTSQVTVHIEPA